MNLFLILLLLALIVAIFLFPFFILLWVDSNMYKKSTKRYDHHLYQKIEQILRRARTKETVTAQLEQLLRKHGYRLSYKNRETIVFKAKSLFSKKRSFRIDLSRYPDIKERLNALSILSESTIGLLTKIAKSDGKISKKEAEYITRAINHFIIMAKQQGATQQKTQSMRKHLVNVHRESKENLRITVFTYAYSLQNTSRHTKSKLLQQLVKIAILDGFSSYKEQLIIDTGLAMGLHFRYIQQLIGSRPKQKQKNRYRQQNNRKKKNHIPEYYHILGCTPDDDKASIKKRYRDLVKKYHPDKIESETSDPVFKEQMKQKIQEINLAYETIKKEKNL